MNNEDLLKLINAKPDSFVQILKAHHKAFYKEIDEI